MQGKATVTATLTVIPANVHDADRALAEFVDAKHALDAAIEKSESLGLLGGVDVARSRFDITFSIYQEAARARDAMAANALAASNNAVAVESSFMSRRIPG